VGRGGKGAGGGSRELLPEIVPRATEPATIVYILRKIEILTICLVGYTLSFVCIFSTFLKNPCSLLQKWKSRCN